MHVVICAVKPDKGLIELFVIAESRQMLAVWQPVKYPARARIEKILKGRALQKDEFVALATAIPAIVGKQIQGKTIKELRELVGQSFFLDWNPAEAVTLPLKVEGGES